VKLELIRFTDVEPTLALGDRLAMLVESVGDRLHIEMPQVLPRYVNGYRAQESVMGVQATMERNQGFVAYLVQYEGDVIGVVSCDQRRLVGRRRWLGLRSGKQLACGPMIAGWLGSVYRQRLIMTNVLQLLAPKLAKNPYMVGVPWTLVRKGHIYVQDHITDSKNGFGGFEPGPVDDYAKVDGVERLRQLYTARYDIGDIGKLTRLRRPSTPQKW